MIIDCLLVVNAIALAQMISLQIEPLNSFCTLTFPLPQSINDRISSHFFLPLLSL